MNVTFKQRFTHETLEWNCTLDFTEFDQGGPMLLLVGAMGTDYEGEPIARCNAWIKGLAPDEVAIKNYFENEGMLDSLRAAGVVSAPVRYADSGHVQLPICKLLISQDELRIRAILAGRGLEAEKTIPREVLEGLVADLLLFLRVGCEDSRLTPAQREAAAELLRVRPPVLPGTRAIPDNAQRNAWYALVTQGIVDLSIPTDAVEEFCDLAGVAD